MLEEKLESKTEVTRGDVRCTQYTLVRVRNTPYNPNLCVSGVLKVITSIGPFNRINDTFHNQAHRHLLPFPSLHITRVQSMGIF